MILNQKCHICRWQTSHHLTLKLLDKYRVKFYRCELCGFIQSEEPYWLNEAYSIAKPDKADSGRYIRAARHVEYMSSFIGRHKTKSNQYLDYGSGREAIFVGEMRKRNYAFYALEPWGPLGNPAIQGSLNDQYDIVTAFEVFEHLIDPKDTLTCIAELTNTVVIGTRIIPLDKPPDSTWNYYNKRWGTHISFYTLEAFEILGTECGFSEVRKDNFRNHSFIILSK